MHKVTEGGASTAQCNRQKADMQNAKFMPHKESEWDFDGGFYEPEWILLVQEWVS